MSRPNRPSGSMSLLVCFLVGAWAIPPESLPAVCDGDDGGSASVAKAMRILGRDDQELSKHPLYDFMQTGNISARKLNGFVSIFTFILTFPNYNLQFLQYGKHELQDEASPTGRFQRLINEHAAEDATHAQLFMKDFVGLRLDELWGFKAPSSFLWGIFALPEWKEARRTQSRRLRSLLRDPEPELRYLHVEQIEIDGHLLFSAAVGATDVILQTFPQEPVYFGHHHLHKESGHLPASELEMRAAILTEASFNRAKSMLQEKHVLSQRQNNISLEFAHKTQTQTPGDVFSSSLAIEIARGIDCATSCVNFKKFGYALRPPDEFPAASGSVLEAWRQLWVKTSTRSFVAELTSVPDEDVAFALRAINLALAVRIMSLPALYEEDLRPLIGSQADVKTLEIHGSLEVSEFSIFLDDWRKLGMDQRITRWKNITEFTNFLFFDDVYGKPELNTIHEFRRLALKYDDPIYKYWVFMAIPHILGRTYDSIVMPLAERYKKQNPDSEPLYWSSGSRHWNTKEIIEKEADHLHLVRNISRFGIQELPSTYDASELINVMETLTELGTEQFELGLRMITTDRDKFGFLK